MVDQRLGRGEDGRYSRALADRLVEAPAELRTAGPFWHVGLGVRLLLSVLRDEHLVEVVGVSDRPRELRHAVVRPQVERVGDGLGVLAALVAGQVVFEAPGPLVAGARE